mmetsp:Transcript_9960/g.24832  ORF Transcript_9960/g.24832 Transcript_9960/m.24832 type:complete len:224 (-) Transcript_9960:212-883(-)
MHITVAYRVIHHFHSDLPLLELGLLLPLPVLVLVHLAPPLALDRLGPQHLHHLHGVADGRHFALRGGAGGNGPRRRRLDRVGGLLSLLGQARRVPAYPAEREGRENPAAQQPPLLHRCRGRRLSSQGGPRREELAQERPRPKLRHRLLDHQPARLRGEPRQIWLRRSRGSSVTAHQSSECRGARLKRLPSERLGPSRPPRQLSLNNAQHRWPALALAPMSASL